MFRAPLCPSSGEQDCALPHMVLWSCGAGTRAVCTVKVTVRTVTFTARTTRVPAPHNHNHHNQCRTPYAAVHTLAYVSGIIVPIIRRSLYEFRENSHRNCWTFLMKLHLQVYRHVIERFDGKEGFCKICVLHDKVPCAVLI